MSLIPQISNLHLEAFAISLSYGLVFCTSAFFPYVASYIAGTGAGINIMLKIVAFDKRNPSSVLIKANEKW